jgi:hypothetical protein
MLLQPSAQEECRQIAEDWQANRLKNLDRQRLMAALTPLGLSPGGRIDRVFAPAPGRCEASSPPPLGRIDALGLTRMTAASDSHRREPRQAPQYSRNGLGLMMYPAGRGQTGPPARSRLSGRGAVAHSTERNDGSRRNTS